MARNMFVHCTQKYEVAESCESDDREEATWLFRQPLGSEWEVKEYWSDPAATLDLPLLSTVYDEGFYQGIQWGGDQLPQVRAELGRLETHWSTSGYTSEVTAMLAEKARQMRTALDLAEQHGGYLVIV